MRVLIAIGPVTLLDLRLFETTEPAGPERIQHVHYHGVEDDDEDGPSDGEMRKLRGDDD